MFKRPEVIAVRETYQGCLFLILAHFVRLLEGTLFRKSLVKCERSDRSQPEKIMKMIKHVSYSIRYCKISLLIYSGCSSLSSEELC